MVVVVGGGLAELFVVAVTVAVSVALRLRLRCGRGAGVGAVASDDLGTLRVRALGCHQGSTPPYPCVIRVPCGVTT